MLDNKSNRSWPPAGGSGSSLSASGAGSLMLFSLKCRRVVIDSLSFLGRYRVQFVLLVVLLSQEFYAYVLVTVLLAWPLCLLFRMCYFACIYNYFYSPASEVGQPEGIFSTSVRAPRNSGTKKGSLPLPPHLTLPSRKSLPHRLTLSIFEQMTAVVKSIPCQELDLLWQPMYCCASNAVQS